MYWPMIMIATTLADRIKVWRRRLLKADVGVQPTMIVSFRSRVLDLTGDVSTTSPHWNGSAPPGTTAQSAPPDTGKSHSLIALGVAAIQAGHKVRYFTTTDLVEAPYRGLANNSVGRLIDTLPRADLIIIDEVGFAPLDDTGTQLLFQFVAASYERRSSGSAPTGPSTNGADSYPNTRPPSAARPAPAPQHRRGHRR